MKKETSAPASAPKPGEAIWQKCKLETGFRRGDDIITDVRLRKPKAGEMRGLSLQDLFNADVGSIITLLPRISDPIMTTTDAENLDAVDLMEVGGAIKGFFFNAATKAHMDKITSES